MHYQSRLNLNLGDLAATPSLFSLNNNSSPRSFHRNNFVSTISATSSLDLDSSIITAAAAYAMKKHLQRKIQQHGGGQLQQQQHQLSATQHANAKSCLTLPTVSVEADNFMECVSPSGPPAPLPPGFNEALGLAPFMPLPYHYMAAAAAACNPMLLDQLVLEPHVLRSHPSSAHSKPIPNNERIDLDAFRRKDPREWNMDDVIGWMISVAKDHQIPVEDMNMHQFATCTGSMLLLMNEQYFVDRDSTYGTLLYSEFRKLLRDDSSALDDYLRKYVKEEPCSSTTPDSGKMSPSSNNSKRKGGHQHQQAAAAAAHHSSDQTSTMFNLNMDVDQPCTSAQAENGEFLASSQHHPFHRDSVIKTAGCGSSASSIMASAISASSYLHKKIKHKQHHLDGLRMHPNEDDATVSSSGSGSGSNSNCTINASSKFAFGKIKKPIKSGNSHEIVLTASGKPRKRSQHTKGNKLWEFIRDALKDSETCPSVVRWEDENEGVFRIVESEKLARLWGDKKNNQKMTYEKLSRAMRTYYEKKILEPVPKTGLYPKKLVYKFGPSSHGWRKNSNSTAANSSSGSGQLHLSKNNNDSDAKNVHHLQHSAASRQNFSPSISMKSFKSPNFSTSLTSSSSNSSFSAACSSSMVEMNTGLAGLRGNSANHHLSATNPSAAAAATAAAVAAAHLLLQHQHHQQQQNGHHHRHFDPSTLFARENHVTAAQAVQAALVQSHAINENRLITAENHVISSLSQNQLTSTHTAALLDQNHVIPLSLSSSAVERN